MINGILLAMEDIGEASTRGQFFVATTICKSIQSTELISVVPYCDVPLRGAGTRIYGAAGGGGVASKTASRTGTRW